jgi:type II secretory pathway pseudopilin PulG
MKRNQSGFGLVEVILLLVIVGLIAFVGFRVWQANQDDFLGTDTTSNQQQSNESAPQINDAEDLDKAEDTLNNTDIGGNSEKQLDSELDF